MFAQWLFKAVLSTGDLTVIDAGGRACRHGDRSGPAVTIKVHTRAAEFAIFTRPKMAMGEAYMNGLLTIEEGSLHDFLWICLVNIENVRSHPFWRNFEWMRDLVRLLHSFNPIKRSRKNVAHHYDLSGKLYDLFLDKDRQYSCAYFDHPDQSLEDAQENKKRHLASKLLLDRPGLEILDIGSGWGGLGLYLAQLCDQSKVSGLTLSQEQLTISNVRARNMHMADRVKFQLNDYREHKGRYDRIVSVGMFEHVGAAHIRQFFRRIHDLLKDDGVCVIHSIGSFDPPATTNPWITKYIFPGGYIPSLSETLAAIEKEGLVVCDIEILRDHYAETLKCWHERFYANIDAVRELYDERFCRMWDFYLTSCELTFRVSTQMNFQIQLTRHKDVLPRQRDYMIDWERARKQQEVGAKDSGQMHAAQ